MSQALSALPRQLGLKMPAEWAPHAATWMSWPFDDEMWFGHLAEVRAEYAALVKTIARFEPVHLLLRDGEAEASAAAALGGGLDVTIHSMPLDDVWLRDNGPTFLVKDPSQAVSSLKQGFVNWRFNAWGGKYSFDKDNRVPETLAPILGMTRFDANIIMEGGSIDCDGTGLCLTTKQCLLTPTRNPNLPPAQIEQYLRNYLGVEQVIWLNQGLEGDHTDGHIDTITRFVAPHTVVTSVTGEQSDANYATMSENLETLRTTKIATGGELQVIELPLPKNALHLDDGTRLPATYANFYFVNGAVLVPQYGDPHDLEALKVLRSCFPKHEVIGLSSRHIIMGGGSFHCLTQQQPRV